LAVERELQRVGVAVARHALGIEARGIEAGGDAGSEARVEAAIEAGDEAAEIVGDAVAVGVAGNRAEGAEPAAPYAPLRLEIAGVRLGVWRLGVGAVVGAQRLVAAAGQAGRPAALAAAGLVLEGV